MPNEYQVHTFSVVGKRKQKKIKCQMMQILNEIHLIIISSKDLVMFKFMYHGDRIFCTCDYFTHGVVSSFIA